MRILITGICGFAGSTLALGLRHALEQSEIFGFDSFVRPGSEVNRLPLQQEGVRVYHADLRSRSDIEALPPADWVIDAAANPSVLAGVDGKTSSRQVVEHNLHGTVNILEYCKKHGAGFTLLSTSRVYSVPLLTRVKVEEIAGAYRPVEGQKFPLGLSSQGIAEVFPTTPPVSLYGSTKVASETLALEYREAFQFPVWINRCGVMAGAGQFGQAEQGIFSFWINAWLHKRPLQYIGFNGRGSQVRDCFHPRDLIPLLTQQMRAQPDSPRITNVGGGVGNSMSLAQLSAWCTERFGPREITAQPESRAFDVPWLVLDSTLARECWQWKASTPIQHILEEIAAHAQAHPDWLELAQG
jgi:CDP-paratose 2-epimerase